jgi:hypothetical protein
LIHGQSGPVGRAGRKHGTFWIMADNVVAEAIGASILVAVNHID